MLSLPFSKKKRYLSGIDWVIVALDKLNKSITRLGNHSLIVFELEGQLDGLKLKAKIDRFFDGNQVLNGCIARDLFNLAPYWKSKDGVKTLYTYKSKEFKSEIPFEDIMRSYSRFVNTEFASSREYLAFLQCNTSNKSYLGLKFDHKILDARGAEAFMAYLNGNQCSDTNDFYFAKEPYLRNWKDKFLAGKTLNRFLRNLDCGLKYNSIDRKPSTQNNYSYYVESFDEDQSNYILQSANKEAGYLMILPYLLGLVVQEFDKLFFKDADQKSQYMIPVNMDRRGRKLKKSNVFFNHLSFFYFSLLKSDLSNDKTTFAKLRTQWYEQMKAKIPEAFELANRLTRIAPIFLVSKLMQKHFINAPAAFSFSYVGEEGYNLESFAGLKVIDLYHMPIVPVYPGIGIFFTRYKDKIKFVLSLNDSVHEKDKISVLVKTIKKRLLAGYGL